MALEVSKTAALPLAGFLGGLGIATSASLLLLVNGRVLGVSGFLHRSARHFVSQCWQGGPLNAWNADALALIGMVIAGFAIAALDDPQRLLLEFAYPSPLMVLRSIIAGFLVGIGSRLQNGCTSGHMICGLSRASTRSLVASLIFTSFGILVANLAPVELPVITSYKWQLNRTEAIIFGTQAIIIGLTLVLLGIFWTSFLDGAPRVANGVMHFITIASSLVFGLSMHLSGMTTPTRVQGFLLTPFFSKPEFDPTMAYLAVGALPLSTAAYFLGHQQRAKWTTSKSIRVPILASPNDWPSVMGQVDRRLLVGAVLFGCGWGLEGICPGPAIVNLGRLTYNLTHRTAEWESLRLVAWIISAIVGGLVTP
ncbi:SubName: Full=Uncharacterized protein {ECO:0000313/EMBL:CCA68659.1} [Serendipita indica DSM 11827]|nr:SubName: Full=Uncharacterized protein {ECO:0000313/EMBL:CCA68659.1} [Serendipita indica DSM 11827]